MKLKIGLPLDSPVTQITRPEKGEFDDERRIETEEEEVEGDITGSDD